MMIECLFMRLIHSDSTSNCIPEEEDNALLTLIGTAINDNINYLYRIEPIIATDQDTFLSNVLEHDVETITDDLSPELPTFKEGIAMPQIIKYRSD